MATSLEAYGYDYLGQTYREMKPTTPDADFDASLREKALMMAIDYHRHQPGGHVEETAAKFLAFLKGDANV
jgi:hypothetical protein